MDVSNTALTRALVSGSSRAGAAALVILVLVAGCAHQVRVVSAPPGAMITVDGRELGRAPVAFEEDPLPGRHTIEARLDGHLPATMVIDRNAFDPAWLFGGIAGCLLCAPAGCVAGAALANLALCPACLGVAITLDPGVLTSIIVAPGLLTVPLMSIGTLLGMIPLGAVAFSERAPATVKLELDPDPDTVVPTDEPGSMLGSEEVASTRSRDPE